MTVLALILNILPSIAAIASNPALGIGSAATQKIASLLGLVTALGQTGAMAMSALTALDTELKAIVASGAVPTDAQWADLDARHQAAKAALQA
jgi:hypothetical protein